MKIMKGNKIKTKRTYILMLLIVILMLICVIAITLVVGAPFGRPSETAELNKDVEQKEEHISAAVDIAATSIGTNTKATFTVSTGEIHIYNSSTSGADANMSKSSWNTFLKKIITADGNLDAVKSITFDDKVYAPADSSDLFSPYISETRYKFSELIAFNNINNNLLMSKVTSVSSMFFGCSSLKSLNARGWDMSNVNSTSTMFYDCSALEIISGIETWKAGEASTWGYGMFSGCRFFGRNKYAIHEYGYT